MSPAEKEAHAADRADALAILKDLSAKQKGVVDRALIAALFAIVNRLLRRVDNLSADAERSLPSSKGG